MIRESHSKQKKRIKKAGEDDYDDYIDEDMYLDDEYYEDEYYEDEYYKDNYYEDDDNEKEYYNEW
ncbi:MAG: hypothetical protein ACFFD2_08890 [Promethearchaeota archaeon]